MAPNLVHAPCLANMAVMSPLRAVGIHLAEPCTVRLAGSGAALVHEVEGYRLGRVAALREVGQARRPPRPLRSPRPRSGSATCTALVSCQPRKFEDPLTRRGSRLNVSCADRQFRMAVGGQPRVARKVTIWNGRRRKPVCEPVTLTSAVALSSARSSRSASMTYDTSQPKSTVPVARAPRAS